MIGWIVDDYREFMVWLKEWLFLKRLSIKMSLAIKLADIKQMAYNRQFHIMLLVLILLRQAGTINQPERREKKLK